MASWNCTVRWRDIGFYLFLALLAGLELWLIFIYGLPMD